MDNPTEKQLSQINEGRQARLTLNGVGPIMQAQFQEALNIFKNHYRAGTLDLSKSLAFGATITMIEDIENKLRQKIQLAEKFTKGQDNI